MCIRDRFRILENLIFGIFKNYPSFSTDIIRPLQNDNIGTMIFQMPLKRDEIKCISEILRNVPRFHTAEISDYFSELS